MLKLSSSLTLSLILSVGSGSFAQRLTSPVPAEYDQSYRPQVHFSPQRNWTNDPNGLVYFEGEYHLFYQYNPFGDLWGHMSWGHAVSGDLLHWHELPVAIPELDGEMVFTGSVVVDTNNSSGLCRGGTACLVAIYTAHHSGEGNTQREAQALAVSQDHGRTWQRYSGNPVLDLGAANFRDPGVFWNEETHGWVMAVSLPEKHLVAFYGSSDLKHWTQLSTFGPAGATDGAWECPDLLRIPAATGRKAAWALKVGINPGAPQGGSGEQYFLGSFDGKQFKESSEPGEHRWTDYGKDSYCALSYNHLPSADKPVLLGWMSNWQYAAKLPTSPWRGQMTLARRLTVLQDKAGMSLQQEPVIGALRRDSGKAFQTRLSPEQSTVTVIETDAPDELTVHFTPARVARFGLQLYSDEQHWTEIGFDRQSARIYMDRSHSGEEVARGFLIRTEAPTIESRPFDLHIVVDRSSVEVFAQSGTVAMTNLIYPKGTRVRVQIFRGPGADVLQASGRSWALGSGWDVRLTGSR